MVGDVGDSQIIVHLPVAIAAGCTGSNAQTLGLQHLQFLDMGASGGPSDETRIVRHGMDELLIQQYTIPDGQTAPPVQERSQRSQSLHRFLPPSQAKVLTGGGEMHEAQVDILLSVSHSRV